MYKKLLPTLDIGSHINAPGELRPTATKTRNDQKACTVGRQLQWVVRLGTPLRILIGSPRPPRQGGTEVL